MIANILTVYSILERLDFTIGGQTENLSLVVYSDLGQVFGRFRRPVRPAGVDRFSLFSTRRQHGARFIGIPLTYGKYKHLYTT
jgi:hypothetical protein